MSTLISEHAALQPLGLAGYNAVFEMKTSIKVAEKKFDWAEQHLFANLSGDSNPIHMNHAAARRTQAGRPVLHGINAVLWALEAMVATENLGFPIVEVKAQFRNLMLVGETISLWLVRNDGIRLTAQIRVGETVAVSLTVLRGEPSAVSEADSAWAQDLGPGASSQKSAEWELNELATRAGHLPLCLGAEEHYPSLAHKIGNFRVAFIVGLSRLVGMEVPGLYSIFTSFHISFEQGNEINVLRYRVDEVDERFRMVTQRVRGPGVRGTVVAIARVPPVAQTSIKAIARSVGRNEFERVTALIVGGSRGLGELTAKIVAAGGGSAVITYAVGLEEAEAVRAEIADWGGICDLMKFDVRLPAEEQLKFLDRPVTHLFYFATNHIFNRVDGVFSAKNFAEFCLFYVVGFSGICEALQKRQTSILGVLYPSSVALFERPTGMTEYAMAKAAGEVLCTDMNLHVKNLRVTIARLPRLLTDQTATASAVETEDSFDVMLPLVRQVTQGSENRVEEGVAVTSSGKQ